MGPASATRRAPPHIGVLLDNTAEYLFWLGAAAITRSVIVGINATYRGAELAQLDRPHRLPGARDLGHLRRPARRRAEPRPGRPRARTPAPTTTRERARRRRRRSTLATPARDDDLYLLIFTSGSTGFPKAVRCTQGRFARTGHARDDASPSSGPGSAVYAPLPFFHSSSLFTGLASALQAEVPFGTRAQVLGVEHDARHPSDGRDDAGVHRQGPQLHPRGAAVARRRRRRRSSSRSATRRRRPTSASSRARFDCRCATATARPRGSSSSGATRRCRRGALGTRRRQHRGVRPRDRRGVPARRVRRRRAAC